MLPAKVRNSIRIGITGGIGSGKSYVSRRLEERFGVPVYDCDSRAKALMQRSETIRDGLVQMVGDNVYDNAGMLNRTLLAGYIFGNPQHLAAVNALVHPCVKQDFLLWAKDRKERMVAVESAILFSSGLDSLVDVVIRVTAPDAIRVERVVARDGCTPQQVAARMQSQQEEKGAVRFELVNDGCRPVDAQLAEILDKMKENY